MRFAQVALVSSALLLATIARAADTGSASYDDFPIFGREPSTESWIWYTVVGARDSLPPVIYIATQRFKTALPEALIVLSQERYDLVARFTQLRVTQPGCPLEAPYPTPQYSIKIAEHHDGHTRFCVLPHASACRYVADVINLPGINWTHTELEPFNSLLINDQCRSSLGSGEMKP
jgi:hypothetical protein